MSVKPLDASPTAAPSTPAGAPRGVSSSAAAHALADLSSSGYQASAVTSAAVHKQGAASHIPPADLHRAATYLAFTAAAATA